MAWTFYDNNGTLLQGIADNAAATAKIADDAVTYVKLQNLGTADRVLGSASTGLIGEVQIVADMIADDAVANAKLANMAANTIKVNATTGSANPTDISMTSANLSGAIADGDVLLIYDASTTSLKTVAKSVLVAGIGGTAVAGTTDNALLTFVNSNSTFAAEANLTFDGTNLTQSNSGSNTIKSVTTSNSTNAIFQLETASGSAPGGGGQIRFVQGSGDGSANNMSYRIGYDNNSNWLYLRSLDMDGSSTDGDVLRVADGTDDVTFLGTITTSSVGTTAGNLTLAAAVGNDVLIGDGTTLLSVDGGTNDVAVSENNSMPSVTKGIAKAWGTCASDGSIGNTYNVNTYTRTSAGNYRVTFGSGTAMEYSDFVAFSSAIMDGYLSQPYAFSTGQLDVTTRNSSHSSADIANCFVVFGEAT